MISKLLSRRKSKSNEESVFDIIKFSIKKFIEAESSPEGKVNFLFGVFTLILVISICVPNTVLSVASMIFPQVEPSIPWYGILIFYILALVYFIFCAGKLMKIKSLKDS